MRENRRLSVVETANELAYLSQLV